MSEQAEHPGKYLKRLLAEKGLLQSDLAFILGLAPPIINAIVSERRSVNAELSKALGLVLGYPANHFADLQTAYDLARADDPDPAVATRADLLSKYPIRDMIRRQWLRDADAESLQLQLARFFNVKGPDEIPYLAHAAKKTDYELREIPPAQLAWLFRVRQIAHAMPSIKYSERALEGALLRLQSLIAEPEEARHVPRILMECGVRFIMVEPLPGAKIDGVCFWLDSNSPVIGLSSRFDRVDNFWFVLRHEIEHVLRRHGTDQEMVDAELEGKRAGTDETLPPDERVANAAAASFCVPTDKLESFIRRKRPFYYENDLVAFAKLHHTHPGLVVGQLQRRLDRYDYLRKYQVKIRQYVLPGVIADGWGQSVPLKGVWE
jgi:HTH-type transcriptional regulator / antitoxin HigA